MPRKPRFNLIGVPQHVIQRGNNREACFMGEPDYARYLHALRESASRFQCAVHAYVLMTNHVHLLVTPMFAHGIPQMMQALGRRYVCYVNKTYQRTGTLWEGRYKASLIDSERYLLACMRYIELNPVRAGMVNRSGEYRWSSYHANAQGSADPLVSHHPLYLALGAQPEERRCAYRKLFRARLSAQILGDIRAALDHELVLGCSQFKDRVEGLIRRPTRPGQPGRPRVGEDAGEYVV